MLLGKHILCRFLMLHLLLSFTSSCLIIIQLLVASLLSLLSVYHAVDVPDILVQPLLPLEYPGYEPADPRFSPRLLVGIAEPRIWINH